MIGKTMIYCKIMSITPGLMKVCKHFLVGLYLEDLCSGGLIFVSLLG